MFRTKRTFKVKSKSSSLNFHWNKKKVLQGQSPTLKYYLRASLFEGNSFNFGSSKQSRNEPIIKLILRYVEKFVPVQGNQAENSLPKRLFIYKHLEKQNICTYLDLKYNFFYCIENNKKHRHFRKIIRS